MDSRLYGYSDIRGSLHPLKYKANDKLSYGFVFCYLALMIIMKVVGA
jgi:energy-coupling factor transporter transmembrane protein EcfT